MYRAWIYRGGFPSGADDSNVLRFTRFSDAELCEIANRVLADDVASRIQYTANLAAFADFPAGKATSSAASSVLCPVPIADNPEVLMAVQAAALVHDIGYLAAERMRGVMPDVFDALKHPTLWRVFSEGLADKEEQHRVLDGDVASLGTISRSFVDWLCFKAEQRRSAIPRDTTRAMLRKVASEFDDPQRAGTIEEDWIQPALSATGCSVLVAGQAFREIESLGLILKVDTQRWKWRHPFMCEHLAKLDV